MLKRLLILLIPILVFSCDEEYTGDIDVSGYCYDTCGGTPLVNYRVSYSNWGASFETYTDSFGYFKLVGSYSFTSRKPPDQEFITFRDTSRKSECCNYFWISEYSDFQNDTVYAYHTVNSVLQLKSPTGLTTSIEDTVFIRLSRFRDYDGTYWPTIRSNTSSYSIDYHFYYVGPFSNDQVLDTLKTMIDPHVGYSEGSFGSIYILRGPNLKDNTGRGTYSFVNGQGNIGCDEYEMIEVILE